MCCEESRTCEHIICVSSSYSGAVAASGGVRLSQLPDQAGQVYDIGPGMRNLFSESPVVALYASEGSTQRSACAEVVRDDTRTFDILICSE